MYNSENVAPDIIRIVFNGADVPGLFKRAGMAFDFRERFVDPESIWIVIERNSRRLFSLYGIAHGVEMTLKFNDFQPKGSMAVTNIQEPPFTGRYTVATEQRPEVFMQGDLHAELHTL